MTGRRPTTLLALLAIFSVLLPEAAAQFQPAQVDVQVTLSRDRVDLRPGDLVRIEVRLQAVLFCSQGFPVNDAVSVQATPGANSSADTVLWRMEPSSVQATWRSSPNQQGTYRLDGRTNVSVTVLQTAHENRTTLDRVVWSGQGAGGAFQCTPNGYQWEVRSPPQLTVAVDLRGGSVPEGPGPGGLGAASSGAPAGAWLVYGATAAVAAIGVGLVVGAFMHLRRVR